MKRKSSNRAWRHSTSSTKKRRDPCGPGSGPLPLAVPVASSRAWEGKAVPVLRARLRLAAMPIRPRLVPTGQRTSTCGKSHRKRACRHVKSGRGLCPRATSVASLAGRAKTKKDQALDCQLHSKRKLEPKGLFRQQQTKPRAPKRQPLLPRIAVAAAMSGPRAAAPRIAARPPGSGSKQRAQPPNLGGGET